MTQWLKQSTAATIPFGPFLDETDGKTAETGLTISQGDIRLSKNGGDIAQTHNAAGATHDELGIYSIPLDTTDTDTLGRLKVLVHESGALPVWQEFMVVPANVWDAMFGADYLQVDAVQIEGGDASDALSAATPTVTLADDAITAAKFDESTAFPLKSADTGATAVARTGADGDTLETISDQLDAVPTAEENADQVWDETLVGHAGAGSAGEALAAAGTAGDPWATALPGAYGAGTAGLLLGTTIPNAIDTIDNFLDTEVAAILEDTGTTIPATLTTIEGKIDTADTVVDAIKAVTDAIGATGSGLSAVPWNAAWDAEVQSECTDAITAAGLSTLDAAGVRTAVGMAGADLDAQLAALPTANENADALLGRNIAGGSSVGRTVKQALRALRNKIAIAAGTMTVYAEDDTTESWTAALTTDAAAEPITVVDPA